MKDTLYYMGLTACLFIGATAAVLTFLYVDAARGVSSGIDPRASQMSFAYFGILIGMYCSLG